MGRIRSEQRGNLRDYDYDWSRFWQSRERAEDIAAIGRDGCWCTHVCFILASLKASKKALHLHQVDSRKDTDVKSFTNRA